LINEVNCTVCTGYSATDLSTYVKYELPFPTVSSVYISLPAHFYELISNIWHFDASWSRRCHKNLQKCTQISFR